MTPDADHHPTSRIPVDVRIGIVIVIALSVGLGVVLIVNTIEDIMFRTAAHEQFFLWNAMAADPTRTAEDILARVHMERSFKSAFAGLFASLVTGLIGWWIARPPKRRRLPFRTPRRISRRQLARAAGSNIRRYRGRDYPRVE
jgi:hypothetical protein